jgi:hypothetical protein
VRRILYELLERGMPLHRDEDRPHVYWSVPKDWFPGSVVFKRDEIPELLRQLRRVPHGPGRARVLALLVSRLPADASATTAPIFAREVSAQEEQYLGVVEDSASRKVALFMRYYTASRGDVGDRHVSAHRVHVGPPARFVATCHRSGTLKTFRVDGIISGRLDERESCRPADESALDAYQKGSLDGFHEGGTSRPFAFFVRNPEARWVKNNLLDGMTAESQGDGVRVTVMARHLDGERSVLAQTLAQHVGKQSPLFKLLSPEQSDGLVATLARTIDGALKTQTDHVMQQFSLNRPDSALSQLLAQVGTANGKLRDDLAKDVKAVTKEFSLDHEDSALRRLSTAIDTTCKAVQSSLTLDQPTSPLSLLKNELRGVLDTLATSNTQFQTEVRATLESFKARREEAARSTRHGVSFEASVGDFLAVEAKRVGDVYEPVGKTMGQIDRRTGDHVITLGPDSAAPDARIVCEAKAQKGYSERDALEEIERARKNRDAQVGVVVMNRAHAPEGVEAIRRVGCDVLVVWDPEDGASDLNLRLAVSVARALCVRGRVAESRKEASLEQLDQSIQAIANQVRVIDEIIHSAQLIKRRGEKVATSAERLREVVEREVGGLQEQVRGLRAGER